MGRRDGNLTRGPHAAPQPDALGSRLAATGGGRSCLRLPGVGQADHLGALRGQAAWILTPAPPLPAGPQVGSLNALCLSLLSMKWHEVSL